MKIYFVQIGEINLFANVTVLFVESARIAVI